MGTKTINKTVLTKAQLVEELERVTRDLQKVRDGHNTTLGTLETERAQFNVARAQFTKDRKTFQQYRLAREEAQSRFLADVSKAQNRLFEKIDEANERVRVTDRKIHNQRTQLSLLQEKVTAMKTFRGILRTLGQRLGVCR